jgi:hypothetical protein
MVIGVWVLGFNFRAEMKMAQPFPPALNLTFITAINRTIIYNNLI